MNYMYTRRGNYRERDVEIEEEEEAIQRPHRPDP